MEKFKNSNLGKYAYSKERNLWLGEIIEEADECFGIDDGVDFIYWLKDEIEVVEKNKSPLTDVEKIILESIDENYNYLIVTKYNQKLLCKAEPNYGADIEYGDNYTNQYIAVSDTGKEQLVELSVKENLFNPNSLVNLSIELSPAVKNIKVIIDIKDAIDKTKKIKMSDKIFCI